MNNNRIAAMTTEVKKNKWPGRTDFGAMFDALLGTAYATAMKQNAPVAFMFVGQTEPTPVTGLVSQVCVAHPAELPVAIENILKTAKQAGQIPDEVLVALSESILDLAKEDESCGPSDEN